MSERALLRYEKELDQLGVMNTFVQRKRGQILEKTNQLFTSKLEATSKLGEVKHPYGLAVYLER